MAKTKTDGLTEINVDTLAGMMAEIELIDERIHALNAQRKTMKDRFTKYCDYDPDYAQPGKLLDPKCKHERTAIRDAQFAVDRDTGNETCEPEKLQLVCDTCGKILEWVDG